MTRTSPRLTSALAYVGLYLKQIFSSFSAYSFFDYLASAIALFRSKVELKFKFSGSKRTHSEKSVIARSSWFSLKATDAYSFF